MNAGMRLDACSRIERVAYPAYHGRYLFFKEGAP